MRLGAGFRFVLYVLLTGVAGWVTTGTLTESWKPWGPIAAAAAAGATGTFIGEVINARRRFVEKIRTPRQALSEAQVPSAVDLQSPSALLRPERAVVGFTGRRAELDRLLAWCGDEPGNPVLLMTGAGGVGKTRLAQRLTDTLIRGKWTVTSVRADKPCVEVVKAAAATKKHQLVMIDYAETRADLPPMLTELADLEIAGATRKLRVLLIARHAGEWWDDLQAADSDATRSLVVRTTIMHLDAELGAGYGNRSIVQAAIPYYAKALGLPVPDVEFDVNVVEPLPVLVLHTAALVAVLDDADGTGSVLLHADNGVLDRLLHHERALWKRSADRAGITTRLPVLEQIVAVVILIFDPTVHDAVTIRDAIRRVPELADANESTVRVLESWLRDLYPGPNETIDRLRPDLVAERHAADQLFKFDTLRSSCFNQIQNFEAQQALTVLTRATSHHSQARALLQDVLQENLVGISRPAIAVAAQLGTALGAPFAAALETAPVDFMSLRRIAAMIPNPTVALAEAKLSATLRVWHAFPQDSPPKDTAHWAMRLSDAFRGTESRDEALAAAYDAVANYAELVKEEPDAFLPDAASALNALALCLTDVRRHDQALAVSAESVSIYRELARTQPDAFSGHLAMALNCHASCLFRLDLIDDALAASAESKHLIIRISDHNSVRTTRALAAVLSNQSLYLQKIDEYERALDASTEAVSLYQSLAKERPDSFLSSFARALNHQSACYAKMGRYEDALKSAAEAVSAYTELTKQDFLRFGHDLGMLLLRESNCLGHLGKKNEELDRLEKMVQVYQIFSDDSSDPPHPGLVISLISKSLTLGSMKRYQQAWQSSEQALSSARRISSTEDRKKWIKLIEALQASLSKNF